MTQIFTFLGLFLLENRQISGANAFLPPSLLALVLPLKAFNNDYDLSGIPILLQTKATKLNRLHTSKDLAVSSK